MTHTTGRLRSAAVLALTLSLMLALPAADGAPDRFRPGAAGIGDPYYPDAGNGGYDVRRYALNLRYRPNKDLLTGTARITARARHDLSRFNLDLDRLRVRSVRVDGRKARWRQRGGELVVDPRGPGIRRGRTFRTVVRYGGVPATLQSPFGVSGVLHTSDGLLVAGQPEVASSWFPVNDHPTDRASYRFTVTVPAGLEVVANGVLEPRREHGRLVTWRWLARQPMASYLATVDIGEFVLDRYRRDGVRYWDAVDPALFEPYSRPRTGEQFAISGRDQSSYKRLVRRLDVPAEGANLSFRVHRDVEQDWDFFFVEAHPVDSPRWTTLPDERGHTSRSTGVSCPDWLREHPFLEHYQTPRRDGCQPSGSTGRWHAATGSSKGYQHWTVDLGRYAGRTVEVSLSYASDFAVQGQGVYVDDIVVSTGEGSTSFEADADPSDGWTVPGPPPGSPGNTGDWVVGGVDAGPPTTGAVARRSLARQPEMLRMLSGLAGRYPFRVAGGIVDDEPRLLFALETQTRPVYSPLFFSEQVDGDLVVVHELAHQWYGDSVTLRRWRHIWLNEGPATYAEWLWLEDQGIAPARRTFREIFDAIPARDRFWRLDMVDPGPDALFDAPIYLRGAMVLHVLRQRIGDDDFGTLMRRWAQARAGKSVTTGEFLRLAGRVSGKDLDGLFRRWLLTPRKPARGAAGLTGSPVRPSPVTERLLLRYQGGAHQPPTR